MIARRFHLPLNRWFDHQQLNNQQLPLAVQSWLLDTGSLTERLIASSNNQFSVQVLAQNWAHPSVDETQVLGLKARQIAIIRETALQCGGETWVYARSIMPAQTLKGQLRHLRSLKNSSLGALLFKDPSMHRSPFQIVLMSKDQLPAALELPTGTPPLWGRRSCFYLHKKPLLVSEIFLPNFKSKNPNNI